MTRSEAQERATGLEDDSMELLVCPGSHVPCVSKLHFSLVRVRELSNHNARSCVLGRILLPIAAILMPIGCCTRLSQTFVYVCALVRECWSSSFFSTYVIAGTSKVHTHFQSALVLLIGGGG